MDEQSKYEASKKLAALLISKGFKEQPDEAAGRIITIGETENEGSIYFLSYYGRLDIGFTGNKIYWVHSLEEINEKLRLHGIKEII